MPGVLTDITEVTTALGMLAPNLPVAVAERPPELTNVSSVVWERLVSAYEAGQYQESFATAFANGRAFLLAVDGLRGRSPRLVEWKGPHRPPGDDVVPADLRIDHVYLVSCKYLSRVLVNSGPPRLFERLLVGDERSTGHWFGSVAPTEFQVFYSGAAAATALPGLPENVLDLNSQQQISLKEALSARRLPATLQTSWSSLCHKVATESARRWNEAMTGPKGELRLLWRLLRISGASYFILGTDKAAHFRLRVDSAWDWMQSYELHSFTVAPRVAGQPEVTWEAMVRPRRSAPDVRVSGHVEIRWSHGRFVGSPEAKVYLDTTHAAVPGYNAFL